MNNYGSTLSKKICSNVGDKNKCTYKYKHFFRVYFYDVIASFYKTLIMTRQREREPPRCTCVTSIKED